MSTAIETKTQYTPDDLLAMPDGKSFELVGGQLVERRMGMESSWVATSYLHEDQELLGEDVIPGFQCSIREILPSREPAQGF